ncbi:MAG: hypothetical protein UR27_C0019G0022 [Candidatus Peregrinibacteria bacterium GW2011_GWA2_33_10]|nr:MAG: hypothetical protein UR27_C0019G0022 [Candidatus Peregrinibacteria bacterium GW2011_GWA2_33_10]KKP39940.1 MAG: hypothetical protein UR30_C0007G0041 [Candidatus Peregrinibacteria bacterium GW2011_GWC2_33_13]
MKKLTLLLSILLISVNLVVPVYATDAPIIDPYEEIVHAKKIEITGTAEANAAISAVGGPYEISPVTADENGKFSISLPLIENITNEFKIKAYGKDGQPSESVTITVTESAEQAESKEKETGKDLTAPNPPIIEEIKSPIDADDYTIKGTAEAKSAIQVSGDDTTTAKTDDNGNFSVKVILKQNAKNKFKVIALDESNNASQGVTVNIEEKSEKPEKNTEDKMQTPQKVFPDVKGHWAQDYIMDLKEKNIINGYTNGEFGPNDNVTRAQLTKIALLAFEYEVTQRIEEKPFKDVETNAWHAIYIKEAKKQKIVGGFDNNTFKPDEPITRAAALKILLEASKIDLSDIKNDENFPDINTSDWYAIYTAFGKKHEIINGYADKTFGPGNPITRAEVAKITLNLINLKKELLSKPTI